MDDVETGLARVDGDVAGVAWCPVLAIAAAVGVAHLVVATRYGWHRDEFYYVAAGRHLAWGYVDQPPLTPLLARLAASQAHGVLPLRLVAISTQVATIVVAALVARELGGRRFAQALTAGCIGGAAVFVGASLFLGTTPTDQLFWVLIIWSTLRALRLRTSGAWVVMGCAAGLGLENKHTVFVLLVGIVVGLAIRRREAVTGRGPWIAGVIAFCVWVPNLWWDARHHWVTLDMAKVLSRHQGGVGGAIGQLPLLLFVFPGPLIVFLWIRGARWAGPRSEGSANSWLLVTAAVVVGAVTAAGGKPYYSAPMLVPLFALGAVATERHFRPGDRGRRRAGVLVVASAMIAPLVALPFYPPSVATALRPLAKDPMETYGWPDIARQISHAVTTHPDVTAVYVSNYGEAGALATYGRSYGLKVKVVAGQNAYRDWGPPPGTPTDVLAAGEFTQSFLERSWTHVEPIAKLTLPDSLENEETANNATIFRCQGPKGSWAHLWPQLTYLS